MEVFENPPFLDAITAHDLPTLWRLRNSSLSVSPGPSVLSRVSLSDGEGEDDDDNGAVILEADGIAPFVVHPIAFLSIALFHRRTV